MTPYVSSLSFPASSRRGRDPVGGRPEWMTGMQQRPGMAHSSQGRRRTAACHRGARSWGRRAWCFPSSPSSTSRNMIRRSRRRSQPACMAHRWSAAAVDRPASGGRTPCGPGDTVSARQLLRHCSRLSLPASLYLVHPCSRRRPRDDSRCIMPGDHGIRRSGGSGWPMGHRR
jgi:hypothetical protein